MAAEYLKTARFESINRDSLFNLCLEIGDQFGFKILKKNFEEGKITLGTPMSWWSWGEKISIEFSKISSTPIVEVELRSECKLTYQVIDWGKNKRNVISILNALKNKLTN